MRKRQHGLTMIELLVVLAIIGLLVTIAYAVYSGHVFRAKLAATAVEISEIETACSQYEVDTGQYPVSSSGTRLAPDPVDPSNEAGEGAIGCGYMITCLVASLSGDPRNPIDPRWQGPYIELDPKRLGTILGERIDPSQNIPMPEVQLLDRFGQPYYYVRSVDYEDYLGTVVPDDSPFATEIWYNPSTVQIVSKGPNNLSPPRPFLGTDLDDITNFRH
jgi:prepilin-type N-terminal cleavage/methylation domain-containing protein